MAEEAVELARREIAYCETLLAKAAPTCSARPFATRLKSRPGTHYPTGDVFDPTSGAQWFYPCHPAEEGGGRTRPFPLLLAAARTARADPPSRGRRG
ncbi:DUF6969 family protein [Sinorhizobium meliloti]|uniref:DUF6969 family protein n=1 Tax=Rhizobium meliloti TaxID=382 RepID=UPI0039886ECE